MEQKLTLRKKNKTTWALKGLSLKNLWKLEMKSILPIQLCVWCAAGCVCVSLPWARGTCLAQAGGWILLAALCRGGALLSWLRRRGSPGCVRDAGTRGNQGFIRHYWLYVSTPEHDQNKTEVLFQPCWVEVSQVRKLWDKVTWMPAHKPSMPA